jgi:hypothetical protein
VALSVVATTGPGGTGTAGTGTLSVSPTRPTGTVSGDRVFICVGSVGVASTPTSWTQVVNALVGDAVTVGTNVGPRNVAVFYRDYDGAWSMPSVSIASAAQNTAVYYAVSLHLGAGDLFVAPTVATGSDTTTDTSFSVTTSTSLDIVSGGAMVVPLVAPGNEAGHSVITHTTTGGSLGSLAANPAGAANTTGNGCYITGRTALVTGTGTGTQTYSATIGIARSGGGAFVHQGIGTAITLADTGVGPMT